MSEQAIREGVVGNDPTPVSLATQIGTFAQKLDDIAAEMGKAKTEDTARYDALKAESASVAATLTDLKAKHDAELRVSIDETHHVLADVGQPHDLVE